MTAMKKGGGNSNLLGVI